MTDEVINDVACTVCACVCDDLQVTVRDGRIVDQQPFCSKINDWFTQQTSSPSFEAQLFGTDISLQHAVREAAGILRTSRSPLFYGLSQSSTDGQRTAIALADFLGATVDTTASEDHGPSILALQQVGESTCSLGEIRNRADLVIYWGSDPIKEHPRHVERYSMGAEITTKQGCPGRTLIVIGSASSETASLANEYLTVGRNQDFEALWTLRALLRGIEPAEGACTGLPVDKLRELAQRMKACRCGVIFFGDGLVQQPMGSQNVQALLRLVTELNALTRFYARRMRKGGDVSGADSVLCWQTGYPFSVNFARGYPCFGPDEFSAAGMLDRGETDAVVLIGSSYVERFSKAATEHLNRIPTILLEHPFATVEGFQPALRITTAIYGIHRRGTAYRMDEVPIPLRRLLPSPHPSDGEVLQMIHDELTGSQADATSLLP